MGGVISTIVAAISGRSCRPAPAFEYGHTLDNASIRLLQFHRPKWYTFRLARPTLYIGMYNIDSLPKYVALSYTWGPPHNDTSGHEPTDRLAVLIDGRTFRVSRNLNDALNTLYWAWDFDDDVQHLWIDAICINQDDQTERATQVSIMDLIYKGANSTCVWLGKPDNSLAAMRMMRQISKIPAEDFAPYVHKCPPPDSFWHARGLPPPADEAGWAPLRRFFDNRWFGRAWVIQEVILSRNIYVFWGSFWMRWDDLGRLALVGHVARLGQLDALPALLQKLSGVEAETEPETQDWAVHDPVVNTFHLWLQRHQYQQRMSEDTLDSMIQEMQSVTGADSGSPISWLVYFCLTHRWTEASDARDKVFGLLGLVTNLGGKKLDQLPITPTYSPCFTHMELYTQVMQRLVEETDSLAVFMTVNDPPSNRHPSLSSWVPDLSRKHGLDLMWSIRPSFQANRIHPAQSSHSTGSRRSSQTGETLGFRSVRIQGLRLYAKGTFITSVGQLGPSASDFFGPNWYCWADQLLHLDPVYSVTGESRVEAFWRTLLMNSVAKKYPAEWSDSSETQIHPVRAYILQSMSRTFPGGTSDCAAKDAFTKAMTSLNNLSETDFSGCMPSFKSLGDFVSQVTGTSPEEAAIIPEKDVAAALIAIIDRAADFLMGMDGSMVNRRIVFTTDGYIANVPIWTEDCDKIFILDSCPCPVVLRPQDGEPDCYTLVGPAYVHGIMYGEAIKEDTRWDTVCIR